MKHKHSLFSFSLMWEGFRQCQMIGIFALVLVVLGAVLTPAGYAINAAGDPYFIRQVLKVYAVNPVLFLAAPAAPLMTLVLFHFLNSRAASDLYHALPHKRITLYLSYAASILAWVLLLLVVGTVSSLIACAAVHKYITVLYSTFWRDFHAEPAADVRHASRHEHQRHGLYQHSAGADPVISASCLPDVSAEFPDQ